jgi:thioredoxin reductase
MFDVIVIGGGPAGLSAALMLGRCRRHTLLCDNGQPRNRRSNALHGYLTRDGVAPTEFNTLGRGELARYGIDLRAIAVTGAAWSVDRFQVSLGDGAKETSRFLLLATGVTDQLPPFDGMAECYGRSVFHCPYCDGWEWRDRRLAVCGVGMAGVGLALSLKTWAADIVLCTNGARLHARPRARLERNGIAVRTGPIARLDHDEGMLRAVVFDTGDAVPRDAMFFHTGQYQHADLADALGCRYTHRGTVKTGNLCDTNVPRVFVAGDASRDAQFVAVAAAEGVKAAVAINMALQREELAP